MPESIPSPVEPTTRAPRRSRRRRRPAGSGIPSLSDVATAAGVSTASASRALARPELVSEAVRSRVLNAASRLGYVANAAARSLSTRRSGLIGLVVGDPADPIALQMLEAAEATFSAHGLGVVLRLVCASSPAVACAKALAARGVDGLMFIGGAPAPEAADWNCGRAVPYADCGQRPKPDAAEAAGETIQHRGVALVNVYLEQLGHRRIGVIRAQREEGASEQASSDEHSATIEQYAVKLQDTDAVRAAVRLLIENEATAIVAASDLAAAAALRECRALRLEVPQRISVVGWGDSDLARCLDPLLSSVRVPARGSGRAAAEYLLAAMARQSFKWPELPPKLVIRESTGPAPV
jgi:DNA-binding LacI/PurR family transcriptional regulator